VDPLDEATLLTLRHHPERARIWGDDRGFGLVIGSELSLVVLPQHRGAGLGRRLLAQLDSVGLDTLAGARGSTDGGARGSTDGLTAWSHGDHPAAAALAASHGWQRARELWVMRRSTDGLPPLGPAPEGVEIRGFRTGDARDADELLRVNAAAFAHHPEQGGMSAQDLAERMAEPWFEPEGLIEAWDVASGSLLGFHWTKRHSADLGEVYVVGIDPTAQGRGLGKHLTLAGLHHLAGSSGGSGGSGVSGGVKEIHLYVEADNEPAVRLYSGLGFTHTRADTHVQYARR